MVVPRIPRRPPGVNEAELTLITKSTAPKTDVESTTVPWRRLLADRAVIGLAAQQFFRAAGTTLPHVASHLSPEAFGVSILQAGLLSSLPHWADVIGCLLGGWVSDLVLDADRQPSARATGRGRRQHGRRDCLIGLACWCRIRGWRYSS